MFIGSMFHPLIPATILSWISGGETMRNVGILLVVFALAMTGCGDSNKEVADTGSGQGSPGAVAGGQNTSPDKTPAAAQPKQPTWPEELIEQVEKHNGYFRIDQSDPAKPILVIQFRFPGPKDADVQQLRPYLEQSSMAVALDLYGDGITNISVAALKDLRTVQGLVLADTKVSDAGLEPLASLTSLEALRLSGADLTDAGLVPVSKLKKLRHLVLSGTAITDVGLKHLATLTRLQHLSLGDGKIQGEGLKHLRGLTNLQSLWLNGNPVADAGLLHLQDLASLRDLYLTGTKTSDGATVALKKTLPKTRILDYGGIEVSLDTTTALPLKIPAIDLSKTAPDFSLSAEQFFQEFQKDRAAAGEKYRGGVIELSGVVKLMGRNFAGESYLDLEIDGSASGVICSTVESEPWSKIGPGQKVKVKGMFPESTASPMLAASVIVEAGPSQTVTLSAEQLAREYAANALAAKKKYNDKYLLVSGEVVDKSYNSAGAPSVAMKGDGKVRVACNFTANENVLTRSMQPGQTIQVLGQFTLNFDPDEVGLYFCLPVSKK
jgi:hypothetical protein